MTKTPVVQVTFVKSDGHSVQVEAPLGQSLLEVAHQNGLDELEGACEGSLACSTCHVIVDPAWYDVLTEPTEDENDMLDLAFGLKPTSRLGCQIFIRPELDGLVVRLPSATRNMILK
jgi:2Fe-2S ferredoxin